MGTPDLKKMREAASRLEGTARASLEFQIEILESSYPQFARIPKTSLEAKIVRENALLSGFRKIAELEPTQLLADKIQYQQTRIYFLSKLVKDSEEVETERGAKVSGNVVVYFDDVRLDPMKPPDCVDVVVDSKIAGSYPIGTKQISIDLRANIEFELVVRRGETILGLQFSPCEILYKLTEQFTLNLNFAALLRMRIEFRRINNLQRKNADVLAETRFGHELVPYYNYSAFYCCVCGNIASLFYNSYRCRRCKFTCHKKCANLIMFECKFSKTKEGGTRNNTEHVLSPDTSTGKTKEGGGVTVRYNIEHVLSPDTSTGMRWCGHCGERIKIGKSRKCGKCHFRFHEACVPVLFPGCEIPMELRTAMVNVPVAAGAPQQNINITQFSLVKVLGRGSYGKVMLARHHGTKKTVALKILKKERIVNANTIFYVELERHILERVSETSHPFLMRMEFCFQDTYNVYFATEYLAGGDLLHHFSTTQFNDPQIRQWAAEIVLGIGHLHSRNFVYRDMKLDNLMLGADGHVKICDFGLCKGDMAYDTLTYTYCGTPGTIAPEVASGRGYNKDIDWWSVGVVLFEMYESVSPFEGATVEEISDAVKHADPPFTKATPPDAQDLIAQLLAKDPKKRLGAGPGDVEDIKKHMYFKGFHWNSVLAKEVVPEFVPGDKLDNFDEEFTAEPIIITPCGSMKQYDNFFINFQ